MLKKEKRKKKAENVDAAKRQETRKPNTHIGTLLMLLLTSVRTLKQKQINVIILFSNDLPMFVCVSSDISMAHVLVHAA